MIEQHVASRPSYHRLDLDPTGRFHLLLTDMHAVPEDALAPGTALKAFDERWTVAGTSVSLPATDHMCRDHAFRATRHMMTALGRRLDRETMGLRLYVAGREPFLWEVNALAEQAGLGRDEVRMFAKGSAARRVYCYHCRTVTPDVTTNVVRCSGCAAHLFVRDHFSRRLNAYAGVQVDAEVPGEIPDIEILYP